MEEIFKYRTDDYDLRIEKTILVKETAKKYRVKRKRKSGGEEFESFEFKACSYYRYHDTWADAKVFLLEEYKNHVKRLESRLETAKKQLAIVGNFKNED